MENVILTFVLLFLGIVLNKLSVFPVQTANVLNRFVIYVSLPALVLLYIPKIHFSQGLWLLVFIPWFLLLLFVGLVFLLAKLFRWSREIRSCLLLLVPLGNTSFLGIPMVESFFGKNHIPYAILYDQLGSFLILATYGSLITSLYSKKPGEKTNILKKVFSFPPFLALLLSIPLSQLSYTPVFAKILQTLASTLIPLVMISVGLQLRFRLPRKYLFPLSISLFLKLVLMPMLTFFFCKLFYLRDASAKVAIFEAGMPPMITAGAVAILAGFAEDLAAALLAVGILLCFLTLPVVHWSLKFL